MALPELLRAFERDAEAELRAIRAAGEADARAIDAAAARARTEKIVAAASATAAEHRAQADAQVAEAMHRARGAVLVARGAMLGRVREAIAAELPALAREVGDALLAVAIAWAGDEPGVLRCMPEMAARAAELAPRSLRVEADPLVTTGAVVELDAGTRIDATLAMLLDRDWPRLAAEAVRLVEVS